jgi:hypothetical protein
MFEGSGLAKNSDRKSIEVKALRRLSTIAFVGAIMLPLANCGNSDEDINSTASLPQEAPAPAPVAEPFTKPTAPQSPAVAVPSPVLIQPTNGNQRAKQVQAGREDPFAGLFLQTAPRTSQVASQPSSPSNAPALSPPAPSASGNSSSAGSASNTSPNAGSQPEAGTNNNGNIVSPPVAQDDSVPFPPPDESFPPPLPSIPEPELARRVAVSGVVQIGEQLQAIVQVPNEGTSRYVRVGQRLSNGEILVKRIEMNPGIEPVVILEQYGVEVSKAIGEQTAESDAPDTTTPEATPPPPETEVEEPDGDAEPVPSPEVTSPAPPAGTPVVPVPVTPPTTVPNAIPIPSPSPFTPGLGEF